MKLLDLFEAPISDIDFKGDFEIGKRSAFPDMDKKMFKSEKYVPRVYKAFEKTPYDFRIVFIDEQRVGNIGSAMEGIYSRQRVPAIYKQYLPEKSNVITVLLINNHSFGGNNHMPMTPWIVAHKIGHGILQGKYIRLFDDLWNHLESDPYKTFRRHLTFKSAMMPVSKLEIWSDMIAQSLINGKVFLKHDDNETTKAHVELTRKQDYINEFIQGIFNKLSGKVLVCA